jgi:YD repeat-containing protein
MFPCQTWPRALLLAAALLLLLVAPAAAHPGVRGGELPVDSLATMTIATNHGCGTHDDDEEQVTTGLTLEVPDWLRVVDVPADGWDVTLERDDAGRVGVVTWEDAEATTIAPEVELEVVAAGTPGETRYLRVIQTCGELTERWVGTPDEPADQPAVRVTLAGPDPDAPPPPEPDAAAGDEPTEESDPTEEAAEPTEEVAGPTEEAVDLADDTTEVAQGSADDVALDSSPAAADEGNGSGWWLVAVVAAAAAVAGFVAWRSRRGGAGA